MRTILILGGPTGSGKNRLALEIAGRYSAEIVNADSRQIYRGMPIGTNQPTPSEMGQIPHHLYGFLPPNADFSVADYERLALSVLEDIVSRNRLPIVVGGTGFYIRAVLKGVWPVPARDPELRARLRGIAERRGRNHLHGLLKRIDPESAAAIAANDSYRVMRALEIYFQTGRRRSEIRPVKEERFHALKYYLDLDVARLQANIESRTEAMFQAGWIEEVKTLSAQYPGFESLPAARSLGYPEIILFLQDRLSLEACKQRIVRKTLQYSKRQRTWFRNQDRFEAATAELLHKTVDSVLQCDS